MAGPDFIHDGGAPGRATILLAHGAGAAMDTEWMNTIARGLAEHDFRVARFEFAYMAERRAGGTKRPPPKVELLADEYRAAIDALQHEGPLIIGGKSMGGRVASMIADELTSTGLIAGLVCLGYPFHPPGKPDRLRTEHLADLGTRTLICQGTRDPFGTREDVAGYDLSSNISVAWLEDGDHDLKPRKRETGRTLADHLSTTCTAISDWFAAGNPETRG